jgi:hypothetical protein
MNRFAAILLVFLGLGLTIASHWLLPPDQGRLGYLVELAVPDKPGAKMPEALTQMGAFPAAMFTNPKPQATPEKIFLLPGFSSKITLSDCALGTVPKEVKGVGFAGVTSGVKRGNKLLTIAGREIEVAAELRSLGPRFDEALVMNDSPPWRKALKQAGWKMEPLIVILGKNYPEQQWLLAALKTQESSGQAGWSSVTAHGSPPRFSSRTVLLTGLVLALIGGVIVLRQVRSITPAEIARRLGRN